MSEFRSYKISVVLICLALILAACAPSTQNESVISTAVAQTVEANQQTLATDTPLPPLPTLPPTLTPGALTPAAANTPTEGPTLPSAPVSADCIHATFVSEYPPDQALFKPGDAFTKTWTIRNEGTCTWDTTYKLIFWSGDAMGGATFYYLPQAVPPGSDVSISIPLIAPPVEGIYTGYWRLQTPRNAVFGVGQYSQAIFTTIQVDKRPQREYGVIDVTYDIVRDPATGCPANVNYTVYANITVNGAVDIAYRWLQKDGNESAIKTLSFTAAGTKTVERSWKVGKGDSSNDRWMQIIVLEPEYMEFTKAVWPNNCP